MLMTPCTFSFLFSFEQNTFSFEQNTFRRWMIKLSAIVDSYEYQSTIKVSKSIFGEKTLCMKTIFDNK